MQNHNTWFDTLNSNTIQNLHDHTQRWTSSAYQINFGLISLVDSKQFQHESFRLSAWGLSTNLNQLLADYSDNEIRESVNWLTLQQNTYVAIMLEDAMLNLGTELNLMMIDQIFIAVDAELYLPRGLRMIVTCITNIVQIDAEKHELDKFVAVVDPGEAHIYTQERRIMNVGQTQQIAQ